MKLLKVKRITYEIEKMISNYPLLRGMFSPLGRCRRQRGDVFQLKSQSFFQFSLPKHLSFKQLLFITFLLLGTANLYSQTKDDFVEIEIDQTIDNVQPMTGIVYWRGSYTNTDAISLEFSYMLFNQVVSDSGDYNWEIVEDYLNQIASRGHQAIFRFRYAYVGKQTSVPDYIKAMPDYNEIEGTSEGRPTWFPDWTNDELKRFSLEFYTKFAERYDNDPRLAFIQVGFGLWAEYHIYDGPFELGVTFPSKQFQTEFFHHLDTTFVNTPFSMSIDAASDIYSPFSVDEELYNINFGLFDDSFMHQHFGEEGEYNTESWNFFDRDRYLLNPAGGEFSYYSSYDQEHVLDWPDGSWGHPFEYWASEFHISYIIGADQSKYQTDNRIKQASMAAGYKFKLVSLKVSSDSAVAIVKNVGIAPIYYDAFISVDGVRSPISLKLLAPGDEIECSVSKGGTEAIVKIESDRLVEGQEIGFLGTENFLAVLEKPEQQNIFRVFPTLVRCGSIISIEEINFSQNGFGVKIFDTNANLMMSNEFMGSKAKINTSLLKAGFYILKVNSKSGSINTFKIIVQ